MKRSLVVLSLLLSGCTVSNTDHLEPHQIISAPQHEWIHLNQDAPLDVTQEKIKTKQVCPRSIEDA